MNYFKNLSLKGKLLWLTTALAFLTLTVGGLAYNGLTKTVAQFSHVSDINFANLNTVADLRLSQKDVVIGVSTLAGMEYLETRVNNEKKKVEKAFAMFEEAAKAYEAVPFVEGEEAKWEAVKGNWGKFKEFTIKMVDLSTTNNRADEAVRDRLYENEYKPLRDALRTSLEALDEFQTNEADKWTKSAKAEAKASTSFVITLSIGGLILAMILGVFISNALSNSLRAIAGGIDTGATEVASASEEISSASTELSASATEQAAALQETVASIDEVSAMVAKNADNAKKSLEVAANSQTVAARGKQSVDEMVRSMDEINSSNNEIMQQIEASNREISDIVKVISEIGNKTKVINDIVFQTKLLSFNASVEAARAGEHGKGFAVVAEEVGNLAQMSGNAAKEISQMLDGSIQKVEGIVNNTRSKVDKLVATGKAKVEGGTAVAKRCGEVLDEIVNNVTELNNMVSEISTASTEQSQGVTEITKAMGQLDQVTQQNAAASQQASSAGEKMMAQASELRTAVETLMGTINGGGNGSVVVKAALPVKNLKKASKGGKVVPFQPKPSLTEVIHAPVAKGVFKKAVGAENPPAENDPRFEDV